MFLRIFAIRGDGRLDAYSGDRFSLPVLYAKQLKSSEPSLIPIAWEGDTTFPKGDQDRYERTMQAIAAGRLLEVGRGLATRWVQEAARKMKLRVVMAEAIGDGEQEELQELLPAEEEVKKKPTLKIVQDFMEEIDHDELVKRAEEATKAICGGGKL